MMPHTTNSTITTKYGGIPAAQPKTTANAATPKAAETVSAAHTTNNGREKEGGEVVSKGKGRQMESGTRRS
jgi:hypothetical protein